jgi:hypothetical protein
MEQKALPACLSLVIKAKVHKTGRGRGCGGRGARGGGGERRGNVRTWGVPKDDGEKDEGRMGKCPCQL